MARFCSLFSSSKGNCTYIGYSTGGILIDTGVSAKRIKNALHQIDVDLGTIKAIFITHEHSDHISGLRVLASSNGIDVYSSGGTIEALERMGNLNGNFMSDIIPENGIEIADMYIKAFPTSHDAAESVGYTITTAEGSKASVATDTGIVTETIINEMTGSDLILLESNHDVTMLQNGRYDYWLKRRILSDTGHLSNENCAKSVVSLVNSGTSKVFLGHLSDENNFPKLAYQTSFAALTEAGAKENVDFKLRVAGTDDKPYVMVF